MTELYIGLMSGTSADGIDAALVDFTQSYPNVIATHYNKYTPQLRQAILGLCQPGANEINRLGELDITLGKTFAKAVNTLLENQRISSRQIRAIGCHGQTIRHHPERQFTLQIGDPNVITAETGITTVADFRRRDIAHGGQGAPLVPAFHQQIFTEKNISRVIVNIGGIANVTLLANSVLGFDTGPGNTLLDAWTETHLQKNHDENGAWAAQGTVNRSLLNDLLTDSFFKLSPPKSTGREHFNLEWLKKYLSSTISPVDVQTTLVELTAFSIVDAIKKYFSSGEIFVCGGGAHNSFLLSRLQQLANPLPVYSTKKLGVDPDWVEAIAFAWLAKQALDKKPGNLTAVTGAKHSAILGGVYYNLAK
jgi:anhydro-N-acetylmuramic acid kinase